MTTKCPVASFIREKISTSGKTVEEIGLQAGFGSTREFLAVTEEQGSVREICGVAHVVSLAQRILGVMAHVR